MKTVHVVGAAIIKEGRVLAAQRSSKMNHPLKWEFPGGKVEAEETHQEALTREIREELGIRIEVGDYIASGSTLLRDTEIHLHVYEARILEGHPEAREHAQIKWLGTKDLEGLDWAEADIPAVISLVKKLQAN